MSKSKPRGNPEGTDSEPRDEGADPVADDAVSDELDIEPTPDIEGESGIEGTPDVEDETVESEPDSYLADLQRVSAEFANYRKQSDRRNTELVQQAGSRLALQLLPVLDAIDAAVQHGAEGIEPIRDQLIAVLEREGLEQIAGQDEHFDPNRHEAAMTEPADDGQDTPVVSEVFRSGYAWNGRVLRAAMVKVKG